MGAIKLIYAAFRDVVGGAAGGLVAAWALSEMHQIAITLTSVLIVFAFAGLYWLFERMVVREKRQAGEKRDREAAEEQSPPKPRWPPHRAS